MRLLFNLRAQITRYAVNDELEVTEHVTATQDAQAELAALRKRVGELEASLERRPTLWEAVGSDAAHYKAAFDNVADAIVINVGSRRVLMNRAFLTLHGLTDESEVSGLPLDHFVVPEDRPIVGDYMAARERGEPVPGVFEYRINRSDGEARTVEATAVATAFLGRRATFAVLRDVTERRRAEEENRRRSEETAALYIMAQTLAQPGSYTERVTSLLEALVDLTHADQVGLRVPDQSGKGLVVLAVVGPAVGGDRQYLLPYSQSVTGRAFTLGEPVIVNDYRNSDMAIPPLLARGIGSMASLPVKVTGRTIGVINILSSLPDHFTADRVRFLTTIAGGVGALLENARLQETLEQRAAELARSNADLEQFAYVASHDLQEPLRSVVGFTSLLSRRYSGSMDEDADRFIGRAAAAASRMQGLINDLLSYSRVGRNMDDFESVDVRVLLDHELDSLHASIEDSGARITRGALPTIKTDSTLLGHVFRNLVGNAIKYRGENPPEVHVSAENLGDEWKFVVRDNGIGIDPQFADRIFTIFQRLHPREKYPGTGIGLSISKKAVERLGGRIWVESRLGQGSTFCFTVPAQLGRGSVGDTARRAMEESL